MRIFSEADLILNKDKSIYHLSLKPGQIADTIISVGDPGRVHLVSKFFDRVTFEMNKREFITHTGYIGKKKVTVISTGMGTDNIEIFMTELDALVNIDFKKRQPKKERKSLRIIRIGTSGSIQEDIPVGSHLRADHAVGLDNLMQFFHVDYSNLEEQVSRDLKQSIDLQCNPYCVSGSEELGSRFQEGYIGGTSVTSPGFYVPQGRILSLPSRYPNLLDQLMCFHSGDVWLTNMDMETSAYYGMCRILGHEMISLNAIIANRVTGEFSKNPNEVVLSLIEKSIASIAEL